VLRRVLDHGLRLGRIVPVLLLIEFLDEFVYGAREAAWPMIRSDLGLSYAQVGLLLGIPSVVGNLIEPFLGILSDVWKRRALVLGGGIIFAFALLLTAASRSFAALLISFIIFYPASGAFVSLSQATLMDLDPARREQNMARWTFAGSAGVVAGPLALGSAIALGFDWRGIFVALAVLTTAILATAWRVPYETGSHPSAASDYSQLRLIGAGLFEALRTLRRGEVLRWLILLESSDLLLDVFLGFLALYMVDVMAASAAQAATAVAVWTGVGLLGDLLLIPLLERVQGVRYLRVSALLELVLFPAFLLAPGFGAKLVLLGALGFFNAGWYAILQAGLYAAMPGQSGTALAAKNVSGLAGGLIPLGLGLVAQWLGLSAALWLLLLGPIALLIGLPRNQASKWI
jgi:FSR family fosmidomycin resistance protein-like MFS transporter